MNLGAFSVSLAVKDIEASKAFYEKFGFSVFGGDILQNWLILKNGDHVIGLFQGMFEKNMLTFNWTFDKILNIRQCSAISYSTATPFSQRKRELTLGSGTNPSHPNFKLIRTQFLLEYVQSSEKSHHTCLCQQNCQKSNDLGGET